MKNIVITGSSRGIGLAMAKEFLSYGCNVTVSGRGISGFSDAENLLSRFADRVLYVSCDVQKADELENLWALSKQRWGRIDHWINNAGQNTPYAYLYNTEPASADAVVDTNIKGVIYGSRIAASKMLAQGGGQIWNMEGLGSDGMIQPKTVLYGMTKCALTYLTKGLAKELAGSNVLAGRLSPGMMLTDFITKTPDGTPSEVIDDTQFKKIFNILADRPETVAAYLVPRMLANTRQNAHIVYMGSGKAALRFVTAPFTRRKLI